MDNTPSVVLNLFQWNCQSIRPKLAEFDVLLSQEKIHIALLNETWLEPDSNFRISGYNIFRQDRDDSYGGVAIAVHTSIKARSFFINNNNPNIQCICVQLLNCDFLQNIISIYCPSSVRTTYNDWDTIFAQFTDKTLITGDFNGHHNSWSYKTDARGSHLYDVFLDYNYVTLNDGSPTRIKMVNNYLQKSSPDITVATSDIAIKFVWQVTNENLGSDHLIIKFKTDIMSSNSFIKMRNYRQANWEKYTNSLHTSFSEFNFVEVPQLVYNQFIDIINKAAEDHIPYTKICQDPKRLQKFTVKRYWDKEISRMIAERRLALANFRGNPTPHNLTVLQDKISVAQRTIRRAKSKGWKDFCSKIENATSPTEVWHRMRWLKGIQRPRICIGEQQADRLLHDLAPDFVSPKIPVFSSDNPHLTSLITMHELERAIKSKDTAPGDDQISFSMIEHLPSAGKLILVKLFNMFLETGIVPNQWRKTRIVPIPKPTQNTQPGNSVRPIALMSCLCKIFHTVLKHRLEWYLEKKGCFSKHTVGFRRAHSCLDSLAQLVMSIQLGFARDLVTIGCFVDITNAYNNVDVSILLKKLDILEGGRKICIYLWNFLSERQLSIQVDSGFISRMSGKGLAQGDPLSPLLFNVATSSICHTIQNVYISQYADDFVLYTSCKTVTEGSIHIQTALKVMCKLLDEIGLEISERKTKICVFKKGVNRQDVNINVNNIRVQTVDSIKYLGLWLDRSLRWGRHIREITQKVQRFLNIFKVLAGPNWGIHPTHLRRLYISIIRSRLDYASFLYDTSAKSNLYGLDKIQNQSMRVIGGFIKSTPIYVMESEICLQPLYLRRMFLAGKFWLKCRAFENNANKKLIQELSDMCRNHCYWERKKKPLLTIVNNLLNELPIYSSPSLELFSLETWVQNINLNDIIICQIEDTSKSKRSRGAEYMRLKFQEVLNDNYNGYYEIYTDGSKDEHGTGAAFFDPQSGTAIKLNISNNMSIMYVELIALAEALSYVKSINCHNKFVILTDSKSALQHIARCTSNIRGAPIAYSIIESLCGLKAQNKIVKLQWVPSHVGIQGNEEADRQAKQAASEGIRCDQLPFYTDLLPNLKQDIYKMYKEYFDSRSLTKGIWYRTIVSDPLRCPWFDRAGMDRNNIVIAFRTRSGHIPLNSFAFLMRKSDTPNCIECDQVEDIYHILMECVRNEDARREINSALFTCLGGCNSILANPCSEEARTLFKLVKIGVQRRA